MYVPHFLSLSIGCWTLRLSLLPGCFAPSDILASFPPVIFPAGTHHAPALLYVFEEPHIISYNGGVNLSQWWKRLPFRHIFDNSYLLLLFFSHGSQYNRWDFNFYFPNDGLGMSNIFFSYNCWSCMNHLTVDSVRSVR